MPQLPIGDIGPCEVTWDYSGPTPVIITPHLGKVSLRMVDAVTDVHIDGQGVAPIEAFFEGTTVTLEVPMARSTLTQLANTIGYRELGTLAGQVLTLHNVAGIEMMAHAKPMLIKPVCNGVPDADPNHWIIIHKCHPWRDFELGFSRAGQRVHMVKFKVFPNQDSGYEGEYFQEGLAAWRGEFEDDFCEDELGAEWSTFGLVSGDTEINLDNTPPCWVTISIREAVPGRWWWNHVDWNDAPRMYMPLGVVGPCRITTKLLTYTMGLDTHAGIFIGTNVIDQTNASVNYYRWQFSRANLSAGLTYDFQVKSNRSAFGSDQPPGVPPFEPVWLRIDINAAQEIRFEFSKDGITWWPYHDKGDGGSGDEVVIPMGAFPALDISSCYVGLFTTNWWVTGYHAITASFEFFKIEHYA